MPAVCDVSGEAVAPEWLVSNGRRTIGPVPTELLLRGVLHGRVPTNAWVRQLGWQSWRELSKVREVSALKRVLSRTLSDQSAAGVTLSESRELIAQAGDSGEAWLIALHSAARATSASVGLAHRVREPLWLPTTSCVFEASTDVLGEVLPWFDPAFESARRGRPLLGLPDAGDAERAVSARLARGGRLRGVAMLPLRVSGKLWGMIELGRSDHAFRDGDGPALADFAQHVEAVLARLTGAPPAPARAFVP